MLQAHNPNYLKTSSPGSSRKNESEELKDAYDNIDEIPIAELNLDVPLQVHCKFIISFNSIIRLNHFSLITAKKRSDKYLEESRKSQRKEKKAEKTKKSKKKSKKNKLELPSESDSDEPKPIHVVNTTIEMPEGATMSDNDDGNDLDVNDPHRALDINLDVDEDFYAAKSLKSKPSVNEPEPAKPKDKSHREKKASQPALLMESEEKEKKGKKKHKRKKEVAEVDLLQTDAAPVERKEKKSKKKSVSDEKPKKHKKSSSKKSEYEFGQVM